MKRFAILIFACVALLSGGCRSNTERNVISSESDSIETVVPAEIELPDTMYESVDAVDYKLDIIDTLRSGNIVSTNDLYKDTPGAFTFRKGSRRNADFDGSVDNEPTDIDIIWEFRTDEDYTESSHGSWGGGTGWTGQPLYVEWPDSCMERFRSKNVVSKTFSGKEIILGSLSGRVYFIDYETGEKSREPIDTENPIKGTISLDPTLNGNLYVGHGVQSRSTPGALVIDLYHHKITHFQGPDSKALRGWTAYDSSPVRVGQFLFRPGENGTIYKYTIEPGNLSLHSTMRYTIDGRAPGIESSMAVYANYGYVADNAGNVLCINLNTLKPIWRYKLPDDTDATPVVVESSDGVYLYLGCEVEHEGVSKTRFVKLNAKNGENVWATNIAARRADVGEKHFDGGFYATALPGHGDCDSLIFTNCVLNTDGQNGEFVAFNRSTGKRVYAIPTQYYAWSSPVGFNGSNGRYYVVTADCAGSVYLISGVDGKVIATKKVGYNFESSPVVVNNTIVVGSRGNTIYKLALK